MPSLVRTEMINWPMYLFSSTAENEISSIFLSSSVFKNLSSNFASCAVSRAVFLFSCKINSSTEQTEANLLSAVSQSAGVSVQRLSGVNSSLLKFPRLRC